MSALEYLTAKLAVGVEAKSVLLRLDESTVPKGDTWFFGARANREINRRSESPAIRIYFYEVRTYFKRLSRN